MEPQDLAAAGILVVEDQPEVRHLICRMLARGHFASLDAGTAEQARVLLDSHPEIRLAIIDMVMPGVSGLDLAAEMDRRHPGIQILYVSGFAASIAIQAIYDRNPEAVLLKPFSERILLSRVRRLLGLGGEPRGADEDVPFTLETAWERLIEGSDEIPRPSRVATYQNTSAAYSIAAAHAAVLRQAGVPYQFAVLDEGPYPFVLLAPSGQWQMAVDCISVLGLSADISVSIAA